MQFYLLHIWSDVDPSVLGPYRTEADRDKQALKLRRDDPEGRHGIFMLDLTGRGRPRVHAYRAGFLSGYEE